MCIYKSDNRHTASFFLHHEWNFININIRIQNRNLYSGNIVFYIDWMQLQRDLINT